MHRIISGISLLLVVTSAIGDIDSSFRTSKSIGYTSSIKSHQTDLNLETEAVNQQSSLIKEGYRAERKAINITSLHSRQYIDCNCNPQDFSISQAWISLQTDEDFDGYYRRFKLTFDANVYTGNAQLYADISLSFEGGPWNLLYTTNRFNLAGNSTLDEYVVESGLESGYITGYYDVLIELYDANTHRFLLDYGPYDNPELSALPLEDRQSDFIFGPGDSYGFYGSGAFGWTSLLLSCLGLTARLWMRLPVPDKQ